jgi:hypothetical protein
LIKLCETSPGTAAANAFPQAASSNRSVFYHSDGSAKSVSEVYEWATRQPSNYVVPDSAPVDQAPSQVEYVTALAKLENSLLAGALLSESSSADATSSGTFSPFRLTHTLLDILSSEQGIARDRDAS